MAPMRRTSRSRRPCARGDVLCAEPGRSHPCPEGVPGRLGKPTSRTASMYVDEKSDEAIVLAKRLNKGRQLVLFGGFALASALVPNDLQERIAGLVKLVKLWGTGNMIKTVMASQAANQDAVGQFAKLERLSASPGAIKEILLLNGQIDVRAILPTVQAPTLVLHRRTDAQVPVELGRDLAAQIPNARFIEYPDGDHAFWSGDAET